MASAEGSPLGFASPLDNFLHYVPKAHEQALRQAIYNALALLVLVALASGACMVLAVLHPFATPIFWAILTGGVLHPYKSGLCQWVYQVLHHALEAGEHTHTPLAVSAAASLLTSILAACDSLGDYLFARWKMLLALGIGCPLCYALYLLQPALLLSCWELLFWLVTLPSSPWLTGFTLTHVLVLWTVFLASLLFLSRKKNQEEIVMTLSSWITWTVITAYLSSLLWTPVLYFCLGSVTAYAIYTRNSLCSLDQKTNDEVDNTPLLTHIWNTIIVHFSGAALETDAGETSSAEVSLKDEDAPEAKNVIPEKEEAESEEQQLIAREEADTVKNLPGPVTKLVVTEKVLAASTPSLPKTTSSGVETLSTPNVEVIRHPGVAALKQQHKRNTTLGPTPNRPSFNMSNTSRNVSFARRRRYRNTTLRHLRESVDFSEKPSTVYLRGVFLACVLLQFYKHPGLLHLLPVPISIYLAKKMWKYFEITDKLHQPYLRIHGWFLERYSLLFPRPIRYLGKVVLRLERSALSYLPNYVDTLVTTLLIFVLIFLVLVFGVFVSFELYAESAYMVQTSGRLVSKMANSSMFQQLNSTLWDNEVDNVLETAYRSGRDYIASNIHTLLGHPDDKKATQEIEERILELWDRMYQYWLSRRSDTTTLPLKDDSNLPEQGPSVTGEAITSSVEDLVGKILESSDFLNYQSLVQFLKDNMDTVRAIVEQTWVLLQGNLRFVMTLVLEILKLVANSGSGVVNGCLSVIVYFTALFYLLSNSSHVMYKPVEVLSNHGHIFGEGFADALNKAASSIFSLTFRMAAFYGLWTYLTHELFDASVVMVPVLAATFLAAVPVAGQYLVALPAALELWLADDRPLAAVLLIWAHIMPIMVVDAAIYGEVKRGIHPWLTGLSIVGGIYYFGIAGAILGPLLLCAVTVALTMYTGIMNDLPDNGSADRTEHQRSRLLATPAFKRSDSVF